MLLQHSIPVTVLTGFLGSGKTTLLSQLLKKPDMAKTAVIINEFGEIGLDHSLIERSDENIIELQSGCICCTIRGDLHSTLLELMDKMAKNTVPAFDRVVIETTGLADPVPIIHTLMTSLDIQRIYSLDGVITLVDAVNGEHTLDSQQESVKQVAMAERIILSKTDIADDEKTAALVERIKQINPAVSIITGNHGDVGIADLFDLGSYDPYTKSKDVAAWLAAEHYEEAHHTHDDDHKHHHDVNRHGEDIQAFCMTSDSPVNMTSFSFFLHALSGTLGPNLLRVKGIVNISGEDSPAVIHGVQHVFHPVQWLEAWPDDDTRTRLVFITRNIQQESVQALFDALMNVQDENATPKDIAEAWLKMA